MKSTVFWDITLCNPLSVNRRFGGTYRLHLQVRKNKFGNKPACKQVADVCTIETAGTLICYYCKVYLHEYIHTHTQTYTHAVWVNRMHTTCIRIPCITREKIRWHHNNPAHNSKTCFPLVSVPHSRKPWSVLYWGREKESYGSTPSTFPLSCYASPSSALPYIPLSSSSHSVT
jgi:hypothetical protein